MGDGAAAQETVSVSAGQRCRRPPSRRPRLQAFGTSARGQGKGDRGAVCDGEKRGSLTVSRRSRGATRSHKGIRFGPSRGLLANRALNSHFYNSGPSRVLRINREVVKEFKKKKVSWTDRWGQLWMERARSWWDCGVCTVEFVFTQIKKEKRGRRGSEIKGRRYLWPTVQQLVSSWH